MQFIEQAKSHSTPMWGLYARSMPPYRPHRAGEKSFYATVWSIRLLDVLHERFPKTEWQLMRTERPHPWKMNAGSWEYKLLILEGKWWNWRIGGQPTGIRCVICGFALMNSFSAKSCASPCWGSSENIARNVICINLLSRREKFRSRDRYAIPDYGNILKIWENILKVFLEIIRSIMVIVTIVQPVNLVLIVRIQAYYAKQKMTWSSIPQVSPEWFYRKVS